MIDNGESGKVDATEARTGPKHERPTQYSKFLQKRPQIGEFARKAVTTLSGKNEELKLETGRTAEPGDYEKVLSKTFFNKSRLLKRVGSYIESGDIKGGLENVQAGLERRMIQLDYVPREQLHALTWIKDEAHSIMILPDDFAQLPQELQMWELLQRNMLLILQRQHTIDDPRSKTDLARMGFAYAQSLRLGAPGQGPDHGSVEISAKEIEAWANKQLDAATGYQEIQDRAVPITDAVSTELIPGLAEIQGDLRRDEEIQEERKRAHVSESLAVLSDVAHTEQRDTPARRSLSYWARLAHAVNLPGVLNEARENRAVREGRDQHYDPDNYQAGESSEQLLTPQQAERLTFGIENRSNEEQIAKAAENYRREAQSPWQWRLTSLASFVGLRPDYASESSIGDAGGDFSDLIEGTAERVSVYNPGEKTHTMELNIASAPDYTVDGEVYLKYGMPFKGFVSVDGSDRVYILSNGGKHQAEHHKAVILTAISPATGELDPQSRLVVRPGGNSEPAYFQTKNEPLQLDARVDNDGMLHLASDARIHVLVSPGTKIETPELQAA